MMSSLGGQVTLGQTPEYYAPQTKDMVTPQIRGHVSGALSDVNGAVNRLDSLLNRLRMSPPRPIEGEKGGPDPVNMPLMNMVEATNRALEHLHQLLTEIEQLI